MKKIIYLAVALSSFSLTQCTKPTKDFSFSVNPKPFDNTVAFNFYDPATGNAPSNITLTVTGQDAASVYEISGTKTFHVVDGLISMGLLYTAAPTEGNPATFTVTATAPGYVTAIVPVVIKVGQPVKLMNVSMINKSNPPDGVNVMEANTPLVGDSIAADITIPAPATAAPADQVTTIDIPAGTSFKDAAGNVVSGSTLNTTVVSYGSTTAASLNSFPGGLASDNIVNASGSTVSGRFRTAGFADINMNIGATEIKGFTKDITLHMDIAETQINPATGVLFQAGDQVPIWSYQTATNQWKFEKNGTVVNNAGDMEVVFTTNHLTYYNLATLDNICSSASLILNTGLANAESFLVDVYPANDPNIPLIAGFLVQTTNGGTINLDNVSTGNVSVKIYRNTASNSQTNFAIRDGQPIGTYSGALCGNQTTITLTMPPALTPIVFDIQGQCPSSSANPIVRPTVDVWYRAASSTSPYQLLGQVQQGNFTTTNLNYQSSYDFKVVWAASKVFLKTRNVDSTYYHRTVVVPDNQIATFCN